MRGRLTDTNENRATADYIRARFERAGLKPVAGNSLLPQLQPDDGHARRGQQPERVAACTAARRHARVQERPGVLSAALQRHRARHGPRRVRRLRHHRAEMESRRLQGQRSTGKIVLVSITSRASAIRRARSKAWSPPSRRRRGARRWRRRRRARSASCSSATCTTIPIRRTSSRRRATSGRPRRRAFRITRSRPGPIASAFPRRRFRRRWPRRCSPATGKTLAELGKLAETAGGVDAGRAERHQVDAAAPPSIATSFPIATCSG